MEEKQKLKFNYGLTENQLFRYVKEARRRKGVTGLVLLQLLEMRLDTLCFTLGFAKSITQARQLVILFHITLMGKFLGIPFFQCILIDVFILRDKSISINLVMFFLVFFFTFVPSYDSLCFYFFGPFFLS